jgi:hypothetical protein
MAIDDAADILEFEARRRAVKGVDVPVIYKGRLSQTYVDADGRMVSPYTPGAKLVPLTVKRYSDRLLMFLLRGARPEKYGTHSRVEHAGQLAHDVNAKHEHTVGPDDCDRMASIVRILAECGALDAAIAASRAVTPR